MARMTGFAAGFILALMAPLTMAPLTLAQAADAALNSSNNATYLANNARKPGVVVRPSGLQYKIIRSGYGARPLSGDSVSVYYKGALINGSVFDATEPGFPARFTVNKLIPGWTEALELMREGDRWELVIPSDLGYGARGAGEGIPPGQTLVFDLQLISVTPAPPPRPKEKEGPGGSGAY